MKKNLLFYAKVSGVLMGIILFFSIICAYRYDVRAKNSTAHKVEFKEPDQTHR